MSIDRAAIPFAAAFAALALVAFAVTPWAAAPFAALLLFTLWFFRDPRRAPPREAGLLLSPADGRILRADPRRVSIFLNIFDVHVCRTPVGGTVVSVEHVPGRFLAAFKDEASDENERAAIVVDPGDGSPVRFVLVAGLLARRIVCRVRPGDRVLAGDRIGLIRFGSRVDVDLPPESRPRVAPGDRVVAGESVLADRASGADARAVARYPASPV